LVKEIVDDDFNPEGVALIFLASNYVNTVGIFA